MTEPVNLNKARKAKAKADAAQRAKENRTKFGRTKAEKSRDANQAEKQVRVTDSHRLDRDSGKDG